MMVGIFHCISMTTFYGRACHEPFSTGVFVLEDCCAVKCFGVVSFLVFRFLNSVAFSWSIRLSLSLDARPGINHVYPVIALSTRPGALHSLTGPTVLLFI
ncbi:hypothetical protein HETIRDRAFT_480950 [Heterobasidion irregulare TC 32-1]|uniref:Uncharacterized protein n=1 Tax=Heterobasidion irregulare (strain TC 32-1) TaxID=747525 RepID=W4JTC7_HETIT|nr:uncharacterized protein HETIRDRAFT_480950 [Heterobasidion irregulare TC 32-1]ETW76797.1 hypothetical protein HETIRDRAFT_480950 [Heterobasidion irregulare TC 32-1]